MKSWYDYDTNIKPYHLEGKTRVWTVKRVDEKEFFSSGTGGKYRKPVLYFNESPVNAPLIANETIRSAIIALFGPDPKNVIGKKLVLKAVTEDEGETIIVAGEWTEGDMWREVVTNSNGKPIRVDLRGKPKSAQPKTAPVTEPPSVIGEHSSQSTTPTSNSTAPATVAGRR